MGVVCCNSQLTTHSDTVAGRRPARSTHPPCPHSTSSPRRSAPSPSTVAPSVVGIGSRLRGSGVVIADGRSSRTPTTSAATRSRSPSPTAERRPARVAGVDVDGDLAVISVDTAGAAPIAWADGDGPAVGIRRLRRCRDARRRRAGHVRHRVSGIERSFRGPGGRQIGGSIEHTAPLAPGSSGGPLVDADGRLVGLNTNRIGEGFYLALPGRHRAARPRRRARPRRVRRAGRGSASRSRPARVARRLRAVGRPAGARRPPRPGGRGRQPGGARPGSATATSSSRSPARRSPRPDQLQELIAATADAVRGQGRPRRRTSGPYRRRRRRARRARREQGHGRRAESGPSARPSRPTTDAIDDEALDAYSHGGQHAPPSG